MNPSKPIRLAVCIAAIVAFLPFREAVAAEADQKEIKELIGQLAAKIPEPTFVDADTRVPPRFAKGSPAEAEMARVQKVIGTLMSIGAPAFPLLLEHLEDKRYSCTAYRGFYFNLTVGRVCHWIIIDQIEIYHRHARTLNNKSLEFVPRKPADLGRWWKDKGAKSLIAIQQEAVQFALDTESERGGFEDKAEEERILGMLRQLLAVAKMSPSALPGELRFRFLRKRDFDDSK